MIELVGGLVLMLLDAILGPHFAERRARRRELRLRRSGGISCFLRTVHGRHPNLSPIWSLEEVRLSPGAISTRRLSVPTDGLDLATVRPAQDRELWTLPPETTVVMIRVPGGTVQWAVPQDRFEWALSLVAPAPSTEQAGPVQPAR
ncbi:hypothetical protein [Oerskovia sp. KBS0722]|uniref:hypothetical protein n=1 Tax=Oerskovia sp. KBS0722 TaxID=1179673 RepID=UPI00110EA189|nr:hypothetical protein [Oerskovia sp. KBS0722]QDW62382.1 hypothetical protein FFI11_007385 [Oerskovia sp. KBS0722]